MIYKTYRATNPVRWRDGDGWQVGWRLYFVGSDKLSEDNIFGVVVGDDPGIEEAALVSVWGSSEPIFVSEDELEEMPMREEEKSTSLDAKPRTWESNVRFIDPCLPAQVSQLDKARAEANDLMQRLTESQQEVAKVSKNRDAWKASADTNGNSAKYLAKLLEESTAELAEVKAERDRLAAQVMKLTKSINEAHQILDRA